MRHSVRPDILADLHSAGNNEERESEREGERARERGREGERERVREREREKERERERGRDFTYLLLGFTILQGPESPLRLQAISIFCTCPPSLYLKQLENSRTRRHLKISLLVFFCKPRCRGNTNPQSGNLTPRWGWYTLTSARPSSRPGNILHELNLGGPPVSKRTPLLLAKERKILPTV
ncbi:unnamed protein product [Nezara viridula]|uniref:Uncharacterized protein n=1 Tax=Nezara viridula TaxID=85310 RepID=A0A9P0E3S9_NEZVI|nr:unnamed protein product [Nezara viridula]